MRISILCFMAILLTGCATPKVEMPEKPRPFYEASIQEKATMYDCEAAKLSKPVKIVSFFEDGATQVGTGVWVNIPGLEGEYFITNAHVVLQGKGKWIDDGDYQRFEAADYQNLNPKHKPTMVDIVHTGMEAIEGEVIYAHLKGGRSMNDNFTFKQDQMSDIAIIKAKSFKDSFYTYATKHNIAQQMSGRIAYVNSLRHSKDKGRWVFPENPRCFLYQSDEQATYLLSADKSHALKGDSGSPIFNQNGELMALFSADSRGLTSGKFLHIKEVAETSINLSYEETTQANKHTHVYGYGVSIGDIHLAIKAIKAKSPQ